MNKKSVNQGRQMKFAREYRGYTQTALSKEIKGVSQSMYL
jgi:DNA-binding XRE family transcriptional regulator